MVIPVVAGGAVIAVGDLMLAIGVGVAILLVIAFSVWALSNARGATAGIPFVGGAIAHVLTIGLDLITGLSNSLNSTLQLQMHFALAALRTILNYYLAPVFLPLMTQIQGVYNRVWDYDNNTFPRIQAAFNDIRAHIWHYDFEAFPLINAMIRDIQNAVGLLMAHVTELFHRIVGVESRIIEYDQNAFPRIEARFAGLAAAIAELQSFLPLLRALAAFEAQSLGGIRSVTGQVGVLQQQTTLNQQDIARLLALAGLAALGAAALDNLARLADDPCFCLNAGEFSDLPSRVQALEDMGD